MKKILFITFISLILQKTTYACSPIAVPVLLSQNNNGSTLNLYWQSVTNWTCQYNVVVEISCNGNLIMTSVSPCVSQNGSYNVQYPVHSIDISSLCPGETYQFRAKECSCGSTSYCGGWSSNFSFTVSGTNAFQVTATPQTDTICLGDCINLSAVASGNCQPGISYTWDNGMTGQNISVCPTTNTSYVVTATTQGICASITATDTVTIYVDAPPTAGSISANPDPICINDTTHLTLSGYQIYNGTFQWYNSTSASGPWTAIPNSNTDNIGTGPLTNNPYFKVVVENSCGKDSAFYTVDIHLLPTPDFTYDTVCENTPPTFLYDASTAYNGDIVNNWQWDFNNGAGNSTAQNPSFNFGAAGDYPVQLIATTNFGCVDSVTKNIHVYQKPTSQFSFYDDCVYNSAPFTDLSVANEPGATISAWNWTFGDGGSANTQNPSHQYNTDGDYIVQLIVTSSVGCMDTIQDTITRFPSPLALFNTADVCVYDSAHFNDLSSVNPPDSIITWLWNFGDGTPIVSAQNPAHLYSSYGSYNVNLIVSSNNGCVDDTTFSLYIHDKPVANFTADTPCVNVPPMQFTDLSTVNGIDNVNQWNWDFNTGQGTSSAQHPTFNFGQDGVFPTQLIVTSDFGCKDTVTKNVKVYEKPTADFSVDTAIFCHPYCVNFSDLSSSNTTNIIAWEWDLGNGEMNNSSAPATCYTNESNTQTQYYTPTLIVENSYGCFDTITKNNFITVWPLPLADFDAQPQPTDIYDPLVEFPNYSVGASSWLWHFGDGSNDSVNYSPQHEYADSGIYYVFLEVWSQYGCYDSIIKPIRINPDYAIFIPNAFTPDGLGGNETFFFKGYGIVEEDFEFWIFDRWGETIYYTQKFKPWDGTYKGEPAKQDVYVYKFIVKDIFDVKHTYIGKVTLLR